MPTATPLAQASQALCRGSHSGHNIKCEPIHSVGNPCTNIYWLKAEAKKHSRRSYFLCSQLSNLKAQLKEAMQKTHKLGKTICDTGNCNFWKDHRAKVNNSQELVEKRQSQLLPKMNVMRYWTRHCGMAKSSSIVRFASFNLASTSGITFPSSRIDSLFSSQG
jgi:hypothetical protein